MTSNPKPGQARTGRGHRSAGSVTAIGPVEIATKAPRSPEPLILTFPDPAFYAPTDGLLRDLAVGWRAAYNGGSWATATSARRALIRLGDALKQQRYSRWEHVTVQMLVELEDTLSRQKSLADHMWRALRSIPLGSAHGYFTDEVARFLASNRSTTDHPSNPTEPLSPAVMKQVLRAAISDVAIAEARIARSGWDGASNPPLAALLLTHEVAAYFVLLASEWNMSIDVIAGLRFDDHSPTRVLDWGDTGRPSVQVRWFKNRGKRGGQLTMLADQPLRSGSLLRRLRDASAANRFVGAERGWQAMPWLCAYDSVVRVPFTGERMNRRSRNSGGVAVPDSATWTIAPVFARPTFSLISWSQHPRKAGLEIDLPERYTRNAAADRLSFRSIRPAAKWAKFVTSGKGLLLGEIVDDNTVEVLSAHYLNSDVAMRDIAEAWTDITTLVEEIARGLRPVAVNTAGEIVSGASGAPLSTTQLTSIAHGELKAGMASCIDIMNSPQPGERSGRACTSAWRACFFCQNGVVTPDDIPAMKLFLLQAEDAHGRMPPAEWVLHWGRTVRWIMFVMPLMDAHWQDRPIAPPGLFDLGLEAGPA